MAGDTNFHSLVDRIEASGLKRKSDRDVTENVVASVVWNTVYRRQHYTVHAVCWESLETVVEKTMSSITNVIQELFGALGWQICGEASRRVTSRRSEVTQRCLSCCGSEVCAPVVHCQPTGNQCHVNPRKTFNRPAGGKHKDHSKTYDSWSPTVNLFMCWLDTAFIYCLYLFIGQLNIICCALA